MFGAEGGKRPRGILHFLAVSFLESPIPCLLESSGYAKVGWEGDMEELGGPGMRHPYSITPPFWVMLGKVTRPSS